MKKLIIVLSILFLSLPVFASDNDDLLLMIPPIIAASQSNPSDPLVNVKKLSGDWIFDVPSFDKFEFRFYESTAFIDPSNKIYTWINGAEFLNNFSTFYHSNVIGGYDSQNKFYLVLDLWGPPVYDLGSAFIFKSTTSNDPNDCHYLTDGQGNIIAPCDQMTKSKVAGATSLQKAISTSIEKSRLERYESSLEQVDLAESLMSTKQVTDQKIINQLLPMVQAAKSLLEK